MKVLITGIAGFIGSHVAEKLNSLGHNVIGIDNFSDYYSVSLKKKNAETLSNQGIKVISLDLCIDNIAQALPSDIDYIFHFAAQPGISKHSTFEDYLTNNIYATKNLLNYILRYTIPKMFVNIGTSSIYGLHATCAEHEDPKPISNYGVTKLAAEQLVLSKARLGELKACSLRLYSVYGSRERPDKLFTKLIDAGMHNRKFPLYEGSLNHLRSFTHITDIVNGIISVMGKEKVCNKEVFNIGTEAEYSTKEGIETVEKLLNTHIDFDILPPRLGDQKRTNANINKARKLLGYDPKISLEEGLKEQIAWYKKSILLFKNS
ncbi:NAD-dependent epimerase/dehydratase family protein [Aquimarina algicola]|uniref:NAD-dependent epimerase/dehydratase family protein n=1 Tax=Aquimarina algicola TaxID=2589995 RepID=A0A504JK92_9FLAO|nr:NAD-dependent epimerase/dehydratase family protein [Aquimarina algicola]TPN86931.1 NAD-dependent epimerase/dehydratase family protein [Aquimarina algicola]